MIPVCVLTNTFHSITGLPVLYCIVLYGGTGGNTRLSSLVVLFLCIVFGVRVTVGLVGRWFVPRLVLVLVLVHAQHSVYTLHYSTVLVLVLVLELYL